MQDCESIIGDPFARPSQKFHAYRLSYLIAERSGSHLQRTHHKAAEAVYNLQQAIKIVHQGYKVDDGTLAFLREDLKAMSSVLQDYTERAERKKKAEEAAAAAERARQAELQRETERRKAAERQRAAQAAQEAEAHRRAASASAAEAASRAGASSGTRTRKSLSDERRWRLSASYHEVRVLPSFAPKAAY